MDCCGLRSGTIGYRGPEVADTPCVLTCAADVFWVGTTMAMLLMNELLMNGIDIAAGAQVRPGHAASCVQVAPRQKLATACHYLITQHAVGSALACRCAGCNAAEHQALCACAGVPWGRKPPADMGCTLPDHESW